jgi:hypothetical protein
MMYALVTIASFNLLVNVAADITGWINKRHISVPCKGKFGYGGDCFPKDIGAFFEAFKHLNLDIVGRYDRK